MFRSHRDWPDKGPCAWKVLEEELKVCPLMASKIVSCLANNLFSEGSRMVGLVPREGEAGMTDWSLIVNRE